MEKTITVELKVSIIVKTDEEIENKKLANSLEFAFRSKTDKVKVIEATINSLVVD